jgi:hypothetical protein
MPVPDLIEDHVIARLLTLSAVTAIVGQRIRPGSLDQRDAIPAVTVTLAEEIHESELDDPGDGPHTAIVEVRAIDHTHRGARLLQRAIEYNATDPPTGLNGWESASVASCLNIGAEREFIDLRDDAGGKREVMVVRYRVDLM